MDPANRARAQAGLGHLVNPSLDRQVVDARDVPSAETWFDPVAPVVLISPAYLRAKVHARGEPRPIDGRQCDPASTRIHDVTGCELSHQRRLEYSGFTFGLERLRSLSTVRQSPLDVESRSLFRLASSDRHAPAPPFSVRRRL